jgi:hypothetical protein
MRLERSNHGVELRVRQQLSHEPQYSIVGIPLAIVLSKSLGSFFNPVNKKFVPRAVADEIERRSAAREVSRYLSTG